MWREATEELMNMAKGGHAHSGPAKNPNSRTSERAGYTLTALPNEGYRGTVPDLSEFLVGVTERHREIWAELWTTPQACWWSQNRWLWQTVADFVMFRARADDPESPVGLATSIRQLRDDLALSSAGLAANGLAIAAAEVGSTDEGDDAQPAERDEVGARRQKRLR